MKQPIFLSNGRVACPLFEVFDALFFKMASNENTCKSADPPYPDVFSRSDEGSLEVSEKKSLLTSKWDAVHQYKFPER